MPFWTVGIGPFGLAELQPYSDCWISLCCQLMSIFSLNIIACVIHFFISISASEVMVLYHKYPSSQNSPVHSNKIITLARTSIATSICKSHSTLQEGVKTMPILQSTNQRQRRPVSCLESHSQPVAEPGREPESQLCLFFLCFLASKQAQSFRAGSTTAPRADSRLPTASPALYTPEHLYPSVFCNGLFILYLSRHCLLP